MRGTLFSALLLTLAPAAFAAKAPTFEVQHKYVIGGEGGWDYVYIDPAGKDLYISRGTHVTVFDVDSGKVVGDIADTAGVHGVAIAPKAHMGYTSNGRDNSVTVFDTRTFKTVAHITGTGTGPDGIMYDEASNRIFTFNGRSSDATAIDVKTNKIVGTVPLGGKPEAACFDGGMCYVNIEDKSEILEFNAKTLKVGRHWSISPGEEASGMGIDTKNHLLFSTAGNKILAVSDYKAGKVVGTAAIGDGPDAGGFDQGLGLAFSSNGEGTISVVQRQSNGSFKVVQTVTTMPSARTMTLDPRTHRIFLVGAEMDTATPAQGRRRSYKPNSFTVIVVGPKK